METQKGQISQNFHTEESPPSFFKDFHAIPHKYIIILFVLGILSFGSSVYLLAATPFKKSIVPVAVPIIITQAPSPTNTPFPTLLPSFVSVVTPTATPTPTIIDPIASWSAYTSTQYGFSIKYPPDWTATLTQQTDPKIIEYVVFNPKIASSSALSITLSYSTRTYAESLVFRAQDGETIQINSATGVKTTEENSDGVISFHAVVPVKLNSVDIYSQEEYKSIFDTMIYTLSF